MTGQRHITMLPAPPEIVVGHPAGKSVPLGLDRPLPLLGGDAIGPDGVPLAIGLDHLPEFRIFAASACRAQSAAGRPWYGHPPVALVGPDGCGRGLAARWLARATGVPLVEIDGRAFEAGAAARPPAVAMPDPPAAAIAVSGCANPIVLVSLPGKDMSKWAVRRLVDLADPARAGRHLDPGLGCIIDYGHVSWIFQTDSLPSGLAEMLEFSGGLVSVPSLQGESANLLALAVAHEACLGHPGGRELVEAVLDEVTGRSRNMGQCAGLCILAQEAVARLGSKPS